MTKPGLMTNVESSVLMEFIVNDSSGQKILNQIDEHFESLIQKTHKNLAKLTEENLNTWISQGLLYDEEKLFAGEDFIDPEEQTVNNDENFFTTESIEVISIDDLEDIESETDIRIRNRKIVITERYLATWHIGFEKFKKYLEENKTPLVTRDNEDRNFYHWYIKQKVLYKTNLIPTEHFELLDEAGFYFEDGNRLRHRITWNLNFEKLKEYYKVTGLTYVEDSINNSIELNFLARWCTRQRLYKRGIRRTLEPYQIEALERFGFPWDVISLNSNKDDVKWLESLTKYADFKRDFHREPIQNVEDKNEKVIAKWCNSQSVSYKRKAPAMTLDRITLLEGEGFIWDRNEHNFQLSVERLMYYFNDVGNFDVPIGYKADTKLANFVYSLRKRGTTPERKAKLEQLGMTGVRLLSEKVKTENTKNYITKEWMRKYEKVKALKESGIDVNKIGKDYEEDKEIGEWLYNQRRRFKKEDFVIQGNHFHLTNVIYNLFDNALKYSSPGTKIHIGLHEVSNEIRIAVQTKAMEFRRSISKRYLKNSFAYLPVMFTTRKVMALG